jgi:hypothetical protein
MISKNKKEPGVKDASTIQKAIKLKSIKLDKLKYFLF